MQSQPCSFRSSCARPTGRLTLQCEHLANSSLPSSWSTSLSMWLPDLAWKLPPCESSTSSKPHLQVCSIHQLPHHDKQEASRQASCHQQAADFGMMLIQTQTDTDFRGGGGANWQLSISRDATCKQTPHYKHHNAGLHLPLRRGYFCRHATWPTNSSFSSLCPASELSFQACTV